MSEIKIRHSNAPDGTAVAEIYKHYVDNTVATFDEEAPTAADWKVRRANALRGGWPFIVAVEDDQVIGFAYVSQFRPKAAYDWTVEDTIYLHPDHVGKGVGTKLLNALIEAIPPDHARRVIAVIAVGDQDGSVRLHAKSGFTEAGRLRGVGYKHGKWVDTVYMQRNLGDDGPPTPRRD